MYQGNGVTTEFPIKKHQADDKEKLTIKKEASKEAESRFNLNLNQSVYKIRKSCSF